MSRFVLLLRPRAAAVRRLLNNNQAEHCSHDMSTKASGLNGLSRSLLRMIVTPATHVSQPLPAPLPGTTSTAQVYLNWTRAAHEHWRSQTFTKGGRPPVSRAPRPCQFALPPTQAPHPGSPPRLPRVTRSQVGAAPSPRARVRPTARLPCGGGGGGRASSLA